MLYGAVFLAEAVVSYVSGSIALRADAGHMLVDTLALMIAALAAHVGNGTTRVNGNTRADLIGCLVNGALLILVMLYVLMETAARFLHPRDVIAAPALWTASLGLVANIGIYAVLHRAGHANLNVRMARLHVLTDGLTSVIAIISNAAILLTDWWFLDPALSLVIVTLVGRIAVRTVLVALKELNTFSVKPAL
jgi:cobalt-zinc-cadmium efflux system protein